MTTWISTVLTTRRRSQPCTWSIMCCTWWTMTDTCPATTTEKVLNAGNVTDHRAPMGHSSSLRSFSSLHPLAWASSSGQDTSTTISVSTWQCTYCLFYFAKLNITTYCLIRVRFTVQSRLIPAWSCQSETILESELLLLQVRSAGMIYYQWQEESTLALGKRQLSKILT